MSPHPTEQFRVIEVIHGRAEKSFIDVTQVAQIENIVEFERRSRHALHYLVIHFQGHLGYFVADLLHFFVLEFV